MVSSIHRAHIATAYSWDEFEITWVPLSIRSDFLPPFEGPGLPVVVQVEKVLCRLVANPVHGEQFRGKVRIQQRESAPIIDEMRQPDEGVFVSLR